MRRRNAANATAAADRIVPPYRVGARDIRKMGAACKGYPAWMLRGEEEPKAEKLVVIEEDKELTTLKGKAYYDEWERQQVQKAQYESACNGGKRSRKPRSLHNAGRFEGAQHLHMFQAPEAKAKATPKAKAKAKAKRKRKRPASASASLVLKPALVQPGSKRRKGATKVVRFVDARELTTIGGFSIMAAAEAMCGMSLQ